MDNALVLSDEESVSARFDYLWENGFRTVYYRYDVAIGDICAYVGKENGTHVFVIRVNGADLLTNHLYNAHLDSVLFIDCLAEEGVMKVSLVKSG